MVITLTLAVPEHSISALNDAKFRSTSTRKLHFDPYQKAHIFNVCIMFIDQETAAL